VTFVLINLAWLLGVHVAFYVDGTTIPEVDWDVGPSWAGLIPISGDENETRKVNVHFFFFF
jgi:carboxypeptidase D